MKRFVLCVFLLFAMCSFSSAVIASEADTDGPTYVTSTWRYMTSIYFVTHYRGSRLYKINGNDLYTTWEYGAPTHLCQGGFRSTYGGYHRTAIRVAATRSSSNDSQYGTSVYVYNFKERIYNWAWQDWWESPYAAWAMIDSYGSSTAGCPDGRVCQRARAEYFDELTASEGIGWKDNQYFILDGYLFPAPVGGGYTYFDIKADCW